MASKAERKRRTRNRKISLPGGETSHHPISAGRPVQEDALAVAREARARVYAVPIKAALDPMRGSQAGCCIAEQPDRVEMWQVWQSICTARRNSRLRNGISDGPKCATIAMIPDQMQTDESLRVDMRTSEERDTAAKRAWDGWQGRINALPAPMRWPIRNALDGGINGQGGELWADGKPTSRGVAFVVSLRVLTK